MYSHRWVFNTRVLLYNKRVLVNSNLMQREVPIVYLIRLEVCHRSSVIHVQQLYCGQYKVL